MPNKKKLLLTGAGVRVGAVIALNYAKRGWDIVLHVHTSRQEAELLQQQIQGLGRKAWIINGDLAQEGMGEVVIENAIACAGTIDAFIHNAAYFYPDEFATHTAQSWYQHQQVNAVAPMQMTQRLYQHHHSLKTQGAVVYVLDYIVGGTVPSAFYSYIASKRHLALMTEALAMQTAPILRVNAAAPGPMLAGSRESQAHFASIVQANPLQYHVTEEDLYQVIAFLTEQAAITGQIIYVDGGKHLSNEAYT